MREALVGSILKKYRLQKGITEDELAQLLGIWNRYVPLWEEGLALPDAHLLPLLVEILRIPAPESEEVLQPKPVLNFDREELVIPGLEKEYTLLHLSDNHAIMVDYNDTLERIRYEERRISADFYEDGVMINDRLEACWDYIAENKDALDGVLFTGDVIDCPFEPMIDYLIEKLQALPVPYMYTLGNHDWQHFDEHDGMANRARLPRFAPITGGDPDIHVKHIGELTLIGLNNTLDCYPEGVADRLEQLLKTEKNVLILQHGPFCSPTLTPANKLWWMGSDITIGAAGDERHDNRRVLEMITAPDSPVKAVIVGHIHFHHRDLLNGRVPQFSVQHGAHGGGTLYHIHG
ncbi:MAG: metallophosphoesterase [Oscillospiraceae bacterium]|nr:metallophosphoesterase [Oscillospiraceae bacterium]